MGYRRQDDGTSGFRRIRTIRRTLWVILALNFSVAAAKLLYGSYSGSAAMQADGYHSLFDGASNVIGLIGMRLASRPADRDHPYGHGKYETYASAAIGAMLLAAAYHIGRDAIGQLTGAQAAPTVTTASFAVMLVTLAINLGITLWERRVGKRLGSEILVADAAHTGSDVIVSIGVIASLALVSMGFDKADPIVALAVAGAIVYTAWGVFRQAGATLSDTARIPASAICDVALGCAGVLGAHHVRTRGSESEVYVDLHVQVDGVRSVADGHRIAEGVERCIADAFPTVVDVIVHLEPFDEYQAAKTAKEIDAGLA